jgi:hypothetical protein
MSQSDERTAVITGAGSGLGRDAARGRAAIEIEHRVVEVNGLRMRLAEAGSGSPVVLLHGFPGRNARRSRTPRWPSSRRPRPEYHGWQR